MTSMYESRIMYEQYFFLAKGMHKISRSRLRPGMVGWQKSRKKAKQEYKLWQIMTTHPNEWKHVEACLYCISGAKDQDIEKVMGSVEKIIERDDVI